MSNEGSKYRPRRANSGSVSVKISMRRSDRLPRQPESTNEFRVDEHGALMLASAASCTITHGEWTPEAERSELVVGCHEPAEAPLQPQWRARIHYDHYDHSFWFTPLSSCPAFHTPCSVIVPSRRRDIFVQLGERGNTNMSWPLQAGDGFRIGHTYVVVLRVLHHSLDEAAGEDPTTDGTEVAPLQRGMSSPTSALEDDSEDGVASARKSLGPGVTTGSNDSDVDVVYGEATNDDGEPAECCFCYEGGSRSDPLMRACKECRGSVQYVHLSCLRRWSSPQGSGRVPVQCPTCKRDLRPDVQEKLVMPPALLLEVYWSHHRQRRVQWITFSARNTATIGKMEDNDVVIPDHTVSRRHARIEYTGGKFVLHDTLSSRGTFAPIRSPLKLAWGQEVCMTVGKSTLLLQPKLSWLHYLTRWLPVAAQRRGANGQAADAQRHLEHLEQAAAEQQDPGQAGAPPDGAAAHGAAGAPDRADGEPVA